MALKAETRHLTRSSFANAVGNMYLLTDCPDRVEYFEELFQYGEVAHFK